VGGFLYICSMELITQYKTKKNYYLDNEGFLYDSNGKKMISTTLPTESGPKTMTRDKWISLVYLGAPVDKKFYTKRNPDGSLIWKLNRQSNWMSLNTYVPEIDDNRTTYFYYLCDSKDGIPKYIGKTVNPKIRFNAHKLDAKSYTNHKSNWINKVIENGSNIEMHIIDELVPNGTYGSGDWRWIEEYWGQQFMSWGFDIILDGGWGNGGMKRKATEEEKIKQRNIHTKISGKKKYMYELYTDTVYEFDSVRGASRFLVSLGYRGGRSTLKDGIFIGSDFLIKDQKITQEEKEFYLTQSQQVKKKVVQLSKSFELVNTFNSLRDAMRVFGPTVANVVDKSKVHNSAHGFYFIYLHEFNNLSKSDLIKMFTKKMSHKNYTNNELQYIRENPDNLTITEMSKKMNCSHGTIGNIKQRLGKYK
jgi:hypothetical protein